MEIIIGILVGVASALTAYRLGIRDGRDISKGLPQARFLQKKQTDTAENAEERKILDFVERYRG